MFRYSVLLLLGIINLVSSYQQWQSIYHKITQDDQFSGFNEMIKPNRIAVLNLLYSSVTIFVPDNDAIHDFSGGFTNELVLYHFGIEPRTLKLLATNNSLETVHVENPPLWITVAGGYYVNNAKIIDYRSNYVSKSKGDLSKNQVLHVIDQVLDPMSSTSFSKPTAYDFLSHHYIWNVSTFLTRVQFHKKENLFKANGGHTFFIPIDYKTDNYRTNRIDNYIIDGHVIPNYVLFTRPTEKNFVFETAANGEYIFIVVTFLRMQDEDYVKSYTVLGNSQHKKGEIIAKIVKGNIPVVNGVVHLISQPLAVFEPDLKPFPYLPTLYKIQSDPDLNITYSLGLKGRLNSILKRPQGTLTYFAPRDSAWRKGFFTYSESKLQKILERHLLTSNGYFTMAKLAMLSNRGGEISLSAIGGHIKISVYEVNGTYYIEWNKRQIKVIRSDYECTDGMVHIIDGVFAEPRVLHSKTYPESNFWSALKNAIG